MSRMTPKEMASRIGDGLLSFPVTPFRPDNAFDETRYRSNLDWLCGYEVAGLFAAGGTGEFFSLSHAEILKVVSTAVAETNRRVPVLAGIGQGTTMATQLAIAVERPHRDLVGVIYRRVQDRVLAAFPVPGPPLTAGCFPRQPAKQQESRLAGTAV